jgi:hypothetical protein
MLPVLANKVVAIICLSELSGLILGVEYDPYIYCMSLRIAVYIRKTAHFYYLYAPGHKAFSENLTKPKQSSSDRRFINISNERLVSLRGRKIERRF